ncbi:UDP-N-acetyl-D-mannosaminuronic acid dehydrogenase [Methanofollis sp. W23]|uniref:nucleotide sugar dehydrogenase n=1 Tax=Methanofollis sp. W23 TaxID=2817849 RepID=UPI001AE38E55|nr:nucleotide sugar dehydrogenase [Methanofollis sp. W23]MBP2146856.1 UDP-N-acetyl-D-mannosaminuronic acid dehydrogenase [Methanofollis sp. W23]
MTDTLRELIEARGPIKKIGVVGMGYVGTPAAALFAALPGIEEVVGFERGSPVSEEKVATLNRGECPLKGEEPGLAALINKVVKAGTFRATGDYAPVADLDAVTISVQTPFRDKKDLVPDYTPLKSALRSVGEHLSAGTLVVVESTVTPGTTSGMAREILEEASGLVAGEDFALAHAPERVMVGRLLRNLREHDRCVGGIDEVSTARAVELYAPLLTVGHVIPMTATAAEVTKTAENTFRDLQIAAANQLALYCEAMGVNFYEVRTGIASLKGEGITRAVLWPGAGVGGHCLTKDTFHLERGVRAIGAGSLDFPDGRESLYTLARGINDFMPLHMLTLTRSALGQVGKDLKGAKIALLGWAFLADSDDARESPSETYYEAATEAGAEVRVHDPWVRHADGVTISDDLEAVLSGADAVALFTAHHAYRRLDPARVKPLCGGDHPAIIDGRNLVAPDPWIEAGCAYRGIGRGDRNTHTLR